MSEKHTTETILVIDDEDIVRQSFCDQLEDLGYKVLEANNGKSGLALALSELPDLILTDLRMPLMSGIDLLDNCVKLLPDTPVIVISGAGLIEDVVQALHLGAFDYINKPVRNPNLLQATVSRAMQQVNLQRENKNYQLHLEQLVAERTAQLSESNAQLELHKHSLEKLVDVRTEELVQVIDNLNNTQQQLVEAEKMASLGRLVAGIAHELNTPLGICLTFISSLQEKLTNFQRAFHKGELRKEDFVSFLQSAKETSTIVTSHLTQASDLVQDFKMVSVDVSSEMKREFDLVEYIKNVVNSLKAEVFESKISIEYDRNSDYRMISYPGLFTQIFTNLIINSVTHAFVSGVAGQINIQLKLVGQVIIIIYEDDGRGMTEDTRRQVFEPFFTTTRGSGGSGLGMNILYNLVVNNLSGTVECQSQLNLGTKFIIKFPR
ncbi:MAG: hybrid sensor histidine kinase/response regulator [Pseudomonadales bacterium]|nr:hybrid sensor histidine kinase/response regulator [Pseudomonadales bacterium]